MPSTKVATCCYCGARTALVLTGVTRHELSCASCGAPISKIKMLPIASETTPERPRKLKQSKAVHGPGTPYHHVEKPRKKPKKKKSFGRRAFSELWDIIEDIID